VLKQAPHLPTTPLLFQVLLGCYCAWQIELDTNKEDKEKQAGFE